MRPAREQGEAETSAPSAGVASTYHTPSGLIALAGGSPKIPSALSEPHQPHLSALPLPPVDQLRAVAAGWG